MNLWFIHSRQPSHRIDRNVKNSQCFRTGRCALCAMARQTLGTNQYTFRCSHTPLLLYQICDLLISYVELYGELFVTTFVALVYYKNQLKTYTWKLHETVSDLLRCYIKQHYSCRCVECDSNMKPPRLGSLKEANTWGCSLNIGVLFINLWPTRRLFMISDSLPPLFFLSLYLSCSHSLA